MIIQLLFTNPVFFLMWVVAILFALTIHEFFHAWTAFYLGDLTAKHQGRLTLNPLAHLDLVGTIMLLIVGIGWGKPVPFNPYNLRYPKWGPAFVGLAGPGSNFLIASVIGLSMRFMDPPSLSLYFFLSFFVWINLILGIFNLFPIAPLDGSKVLFVLLPRSLEHIRIFLERYGLVILLFLVFFGFSLILGLSKLLFTLIVGTPPPFF